MKHSFKGSIMHSISVIKINGKMQNKCCASVLFPKGRISMSSWVSMYDPMLRGYRVGGCVHTHACLCIWIRLCAKSENNFSSPSILYSPWTLVSSCVWTLPLPMILQWLSDLSQLLSLPFLGYCETASKVIVCSQHAISESKKLKWLPSACHKSPKPGLILRAFSSGPKLTLYSCHNYLLGV